MKLLRYERDGVARLGVLRGDAIVDLTDHCPAFASIQSIVAGGERALEQVNDLAERATLCLALKDARLLAPIERPGKYLAIGMNYRKHLAEADSLGIARANHQLWFNKQTSCIAGPFDDIDPGVTEKLDYEVELGLIIGRAAKHVGEQHAQDHIFGYFVANDVSARDWQFHTPTFTMGKSFDTHGPIGPWIVTADEVPDPHSLGLRCLVNSEVRQSSNTSEMIFSIWQQIAYLSTAFTLEPGDLIATGTPEGVGVGRDPPQFLRIGDVVRCEIDGIGAIENRVISPR
jgi:2-keto-4-pentenoate hydratase/2-oxohepta-3-ene-1,7-dioic acid hydratase in catechol pathway